ncbi:MAG: hypothetical protein ACR2OX_13000 [Methyloligellaceae bacterium]
MTIGTVSKTFFALFALLVVSLPAQIVSAAPSKSAVETRAIPTGVFELMVGGSWKHEKQSGYYRAIALAAGQTGKEYAEVWLQWIAVDEKTVKVAKNVLIREITQKNYSSLSLAMDVEESGKVTLLVTHYNPETDESVLHEFQTDTNGGYREIEPQVASEQ